MHFHTPHLKKSEKRKASTDAVVIEDEPVLAKKKVTKPKKNKTAKQPKVAKQKARSKSKTPEDPHPQPSPSLSRSPTPTMASPPNNNMLRETYVLPHPSYRPVHRTNAISRPTTESIAQEQSKTTPRRSSRIKNSMTSVSTTWNKARPYIERINGTIMPLEHQGLKAYYARDGVKL